MYKSSLSPISYSLGAVLIVIALHTPLAGASEKKEILKQAKTAEERRDFSAAEKFYCDLLQVDARHAEAKTKCTYYRAAHEKFQQAVGAYKKNDFIAAKKLLMEVSVLQPGAGDYISKIDRYTKYFDEGFRLARNGKSAEAIEQYRRAQSVKPDGPWDLKSKIASLEEKLAPELKPLGDKDQELVQAISEFYSGSYAKAEQKLGAYNGQGKRKSLALFYLGASELTRYYLAGATQADNELYLSAVSRFSAAKKTAPDFVPPAQQVSPKIFKAYTEASR